MLYYDEASGFYKSTLLDTEHLVHGFSTKQLGDGRDREMIRTSLKNSELKNIVSAKQSHSIDICNIENQKEKSEKIKSHDGLTTKRKNIVLSVLSADCVPIIYFDSVSKIIGISHQGWIGTLNGLSTLMVKKMVDLGCVSSRIKAIMGPAINDCCYEVYGKRLDKFVDKFRSREIFRMNKNKNYLNLYKANQINLKTAGILENNIDIFPFCTSCDSDKFYSYHRDGEIKGEMFSYISLNLHD